MKIARPFFIFSDFVEILFFMDIFGGFATSTSSTPIRYL